MHLFALKPKIHRVIILSQKKGKLHEKTMVLTSSTMEKLGKRTKKKSKGGSMLSGERLKEEDSIKKREKGHITFWVINYRHFRRGGGLLLA